MSFKGFESPNYTQVPNQFFDEILYKEDTTFGEAKLLMFMFRYTFGWHKKGFALQFSITDVQEHTHQSRDAANKAIKSCLNKGYIERKEIEGELYYRLKMEEEERWDNVVDWKSKSPDPVKPIKKSNQSEKQTSTENGLVRKSDRNQSEKQTSGSPKNRPLKPDQPQMVQRLGDPLKKGLKKDKEKIYIYPSGYPKNQKPKPKKDELPPWVANQTNGNSQNVQASQLSPEQQEEANKLLKMLGEMS